MIDDELTRGLPRSRSDAIELTADPAAVADPDAPGADDPLTRGLARDRDGRIMVDVVLPAADAATPGAIQLAGDLGGTADAPEVAGIAGIPVVITDPRDGDVLTYDATGRQFVNRAAA